MLQSLTRCSTIAMTIAIVAAIAMPSAAQKKTKEPVFRVAKNTSQAKVPAKNASATKSTDAFEAHPLTPCIKTAEEGLERIKKDLYDYTGMMVKRERVNGVLGDTEYIKFKIRNEREVDGKKVPFSIYMRFLKPTDIRGQECIWVEGENKGKIIAHANPKTAMGRITVRLDPDGNLAMKGNKYPIYDAGIENLVKKLIEKASRDREAGDCVVNVSETAKINKRPCQMIELIHKEKKAPYEFYKAKVYIDKELNLPVRYVAYDWPTSEGAKPKILEEYTYVNIQTNVGLTDEDFNHKNDAYDYR